MEESTAQEHDQFEALIQGLVDNDFGCCNNFLLSATLSGLNSNLHTLRESGEMKPAGLGRGAKARKDETVRGDSIHWLEGESTNAFESVYQQKMGRFIAHLNGTCFTSIKNFESHYASYEKNSRYKRHVDQFKTNGDRKFSTVLYLNEDWKAADGGKLSLYPSNKAQEDIVPLGGRLVFFRSNAMEHEVHPSPTRTRKSIAGWLKT